MKKIQHNNKKLFKKWKSRFTNQNNKMNLILKKQMN